MGRIRVKIVLLLVMFLGIAAIGLGSTPKTPKEIFILAQEKQDTLTYRAAEGDGPNDLVVYQKGNPDGVVLRRLEIGGAENVYTIVNEKGVFRLYPKSKIAVRHPDSPLAIKADYNDHAQFSMTETVYDGIPCYQVTRKIHFNDTTLDTYISSLKTSQKKSRKEHAAFFKEQFPRVETLVIDKQSYFIYSEKYYSESGRLINSGTYPDVDFSVDLADEFFQIPPDYKVKTTKNVEEFANVTGEIVTKQFKERVKQRDQGLREKKRQVVARRGVVALLRNGPAAFGIAGAVCLTLLLVVMIRRRIGRANP